MRRPLCAAVAALALSPLACSSGEPQRGAPDAGPPGLAQANAVLQGDAPAAPGAAAQPPPPQAIADAGADGATEGGLPPLPVRDFQERDFTETEQSRDPFRSFASLFVNQATTKITVQRRVLVDQYALDELKLVGIVTRAQPRALLTDPNGLGHIAKIGDFVGKAEIVRAGGPSGSDVALNWRVDRIRDGSVIFVREDPSHPEIPPATRVVALRTPEEEASLKGQGRPQ